MKKLILLLLPFILFGCVAFNELHNDTTEASKKYVPPSPWEHVCYGESDLGDKPRGLIYWSDLTADLDTKMHFYLLIHYESRYAPIYLDFSYASFPQSKYDRNKRDHIVSTRAKRKKESSAFTYKWFQIQGESVAGTYFIIPEHKNIMIHTVANAIRDVDTLALEIQYFNEGARTHRINFDDNFRKAYADLLSECGDVRLHPSWRRHQAILKTVVAGDN